MKRGILLAVLLLTVFVIVCAAGQPHSGSAAPETSQDRRKAPAPRETGSAANRSRTSRPTAEPMPIIALLDRRGKPKYHVMLRLDYGLIISNGDQKTDRAVYYLFSRDDRKIMKTVDVKVVLEKLAKLPDRCSIDMISKCTVPFYSQYGADIDKQYETIMRLLKRKRCVLVWSAEDNEKHASFCDCVGGSTVLDKTPAREQILPEAKD